MKKQNTKRTLLRTDTVRCDGTSFAYFLYSAKSTMLISFGLSLYSIRIEAWDEDGYFSHSEIIDVFSDREKAVVFYERLKRNHSAPEDLTYIFEKENSAAQTPIKK